MQGQNASAAGVLICGDRPRSKEDRRIHYDGGKVALRGFLENDLDRLGRDMAARRGRGVELGASIGPIIAVVDGNLCSRQLGLIEVAALALRKSSGIGG